MAAWQPWECRACGGAIGEQTATALRFSRGGTPVLTWGRTSTVCPRYLKHLGRKCGARNDWTPLLVERDLRSPVVA